MSKFKRPEVSTKHLIKTVVLGQYTHITNYFSGSTIVVVISKTENSDIVK